jgi:SEC-C motif
MSFAAHDIASMPRIASMATMPSRLATFARALEDILPQVDRAYVYLDNFPTVPPFLLDRPNIKILHGKDQGDVHGSGKFIPLKRLDVPSIFVTVDDDIKYPANYVDTLVDFLAKTGGRYLVGAHGRTFVPPHLSYVRDAIALPFFGGVAANCHVHELGTGTCAFVSSVLDFDVETWPYHDSQDICLAIEAEKRSIPRISIRRPAGWLRAYAELQPDSLWREALRDDRRQSDMMRTFLKMRLSPGEPSLHFWMAGERYSYFMLRPDDPAIDWVRSATLAERQSEVANRLSGVRWEQMTLDQNSDGTTGLVPRNSPCPCGSGKKFKQCHGAMSDV